VKKAKSVLSLPNTYPYIESLVNAKLANKDHSLKNGSSNSILSGSQVVLNTPYFSPTDTYFSGSGGSCMTLGSGKWASDTPTVTDNLSTAMTRTDVLHQLNMSMSASVSGERSSASASVEYAQSTQDDSLSITYNFGEAYKMNIRTVISPSLDAKYENMYLINKQDFYNSCGDSYVSGGTAGITLLVNVKLKFNSVQDKTSFTQSASASYGLASLKEAVSKMSSSTTEHGSIEVRAIQLGGSPEQLSNIFSTQDSNKAFYNCSFTDTSACTSIIDNVIKYAKGDLANQMSAIESNPFNPHIANQPYYFNVTNTSPYSFPLTGKQIPLDNVPSSDLSAFHAASTDMINLQSLLQFTDTTSNSGGYYNIILNIMGGSDKNGILAPMKSDLDYLHEKTSSIVDTFSTVLANCSLPISYKQCSSQLADFYNENVMSNSSLDSDTNTLYNYAKMVRYIDSSSNTEDLYPIGDSSYVCASNCSGAPMYSLEGLGGDVTKISNGVISPNEPPSNAAYVALYRCSSFVASPSSSTLCPLNDTFNLVGQATDQVFYNTMSSRVYLGYDTLHYQNSSSYVNPTQLNLLNIPFLIQNKYESQ
ncbi:MAG: hypothetical protein RLZZ293_1, partial [Pseudomonadota bacterium]